MKQMIAVVVLVVLIIFTVSCSTNDDYDACRTMTDSQYEVKKKELLDTFFSIDVIYRENFRIQLGEDMERIEKERVEAFKACMK